MSNPTFTVLKKNGRLFVATDSDAFNLVLTDGYDVEDIEMSQEEAEAYVLERGEPFVWRI